MIEAVVLDLDGLIIDSEPLWKESEKMAFKKVGIELTTEMCMQTTGLDTNDVVKYWYRKFPWKKTTHIEVKKDIENKIGDLIMKKGVPKNGLHEIIAFFENKKLPLAVASSSVLSIIEVVLKKFDILGKFNVIHSSENEILGKPHPAVYISTAHKLGIDPAHCLAFEDSFYGLLSAKSARYKAVVVPDENEHDDPRLCFADLKLKSLAEFTETHFNLLNAH
jgi:mannitol-1-/sugar-/sorbitol-6-/2-deoxyglucose-6-phosphatase